MKILHVIHSIDPRAGGPSYVILNEIRELCRAGHEVALLSTDVQYGRPKRSPDEYTRSIRQNPDLAGAEVYLGHAYGRRRPFSSFAYSPQCARWLRTRLADPRQAPDVIHINATYTHVSTAAAAGARRFSIPYVFRPFGTLDRKPFASGFHLAKSAFVRVYLRNDLKHAARVIACSPGESEELSHWVPPRELVVVPHGVEAPSSDSREAARLFLETFPQCRNRRAILFLGRVDPIKRPEVLVAAMARLRPRFDDLMLIVAGPDGGHLETLRAAAAEHDLADAMVFTGYLDSELKRGAFAVSSVLALPSEHENFGLVVVEAMANGLPVLVTPGVACHDHVDRSGAGLTVDGDPESFAAGLAEMLASDELQAMGRKGKAYVEAHLAWPRVRRQLEDLYEDVAATRSLHGEKRDYGLHGTASFE